jgi:hypothetical protein
MRKVLGGQLSTFQGNSSYLFVFTNPIVGQEEEYHKTYNQVHLPEMTSVEGVQWGRRFERLALHGDGSSRGEHHYLAIYDLGDDPDSVMAAVRDRQRRKGFSSFESVDRTNIIASGWAPM